MNDVFGTIYELSNGKVIVGNGKIIEPMTGKTIK